MMIADLPWLPPAPSCFAERLAQAASLGDLSDLVKCGLDDNQLSRLYGRLKSLRGGAEGASPFLEMRLGLVSNSTTKLLVPALVGTALRYGILLTVIETEFNQVLQEAFSNHSTFEESPVDVVLLGVDFRGLPFSVSPGDTEAAENNVQDCYSYINSVVSALKSKTGAQIIVQNIPPPVDKISGSFERRLPGTLSWLISRLNLELDRLALDDVYVLDVAALAADVGLASWYDLTLWNIAKISFNPRFTPIYAEYVCRILAAKVGKSRRCLILDLDNTVWGGVIGDDGIEGILIGNGDPTGEAYLSIQQMALDLHRRGVVLAVCSKNTDAIAREPFRSHPEMLLKESHIAVFQANWSDKASNIKAIAATLSLGLDSFVFLDDNPAERLQVRRELPGVAVPELPEDPAYYTRTLLAAGYFETVSFSSEDQKRAEFYQGNARRVEILNQSSDLGAYLMSLQMEMSLLPFDTTGRGRIAQLISKSNQFNLTTERYTESDVKDFTDNEGFFTRQIRLKDTLGDNGMISVVICKKAVDYWEIDTWLMSCRVLGRRVEEAVLNDIIQNAKRDDIRKLIGTYRPTVRNEIVKDHYKKLGFVQISQDAQEEIWELELSKYEPAQLPFVFKYSI